MSNIELLIMSNGSASERKVLKEVADALELLRKKNGKTYDRERDELIARACEAVGALIRLWKN
jgi:hypothetical protein